MSWAGSPGSGNLLMAATDLFAVGTGSIANIICASFQVASGWSVGTGANVAGSANAIVGRPEFFLDYSFRGTVYVVPMYRKT